MSTLVVQPVARPAPHGEHRRNPPPAAAAMAAAKVPSFLKMRVRRHRTHAASASSGAASSAGAASAGAASSAASSASSSAPQQESRGGGTPGSWNLGVAHSSASGSDQRAYVDRLFAVYGTLMGAAQAGDVRALEQLMDAAYTPAPDASTAKIRDAQVRAAALKAASEGRGKALLLLLDRGADLGLHHDEDGGEGDGGGGGGAGGGDGGEKQTLKLNTTTTMAIDAAARGHDEVLDVLFARCGVSPEARDAGRAGSRTALMEAAAGGHAQCVARCVAAGARLDAATQDAQLCTAAMLAAVNGHAGCLNILRGAGADMEAERGGDGKTAMQLHREKVAQDMAKFKASSSS
jgi:hypothetical protein